MKEKIKEVAKAICYEEGQYVKDSKIEFRISYKTKLEYIKQANSNGFRSLSDYLRYLVIKDKIEGEMS